MRTKYDELLIRIKNALTEGFNDYAGDRVETISVMMGKDEQDDYDWLMFIAAAYILHVNKVPMKSDMLDVKACQDKLIKIFSDIRALKYEFKNVSLQGTVESETFKA